MKKILALVVSLTVISGVCAAILAYVNSVTAEPIRQTAAANEQKAILAVMPKGVVKIEPVGEAFVGRNAAGEIAGYAAKGRDPGGYGGDIVLMVGFQPDQKTLASYRVLQATETPGLGMKLKDDSFAGQFRDKDATALKLKKKGGDIEAITSATITSKAVCRALADAQKKL